MREQALIIWRDQNTRLFTLHIWGIHIFCISLQCTFLTWLKYLKSINEYLCHISKLGMRPTMLNQLFWQWQKATGFSLCFLRFQNSFNFFFLLYLKQWVCEFCRCLLLSLTYNSFAYIGINNQIVIRWIYTTYIRACITMVTSKSTLTEFAQHLHWNFRHSISS